jgi:hypothetical protein
MDTGKSVIINMDKGKGVIGEPAPIFPSDGLDAQVPVPPLPSGGLGAQVPLPPLPSGGLGAHVPVAQLPSAGLGAHVPMPQVLLYLVSFESSTMVLCYHVPPLPNTWKHASAICPP